MPMEQNTDFHMFLFYLICLWWESTLWFLSSQYHNMASLSNSQFCTQYYTYWKVTYFCRTIKLQIINQMIYDYLDYAWKCLWMHVDSRVALKQKEAALDSTTHEWNKKVQMSIQGVWFLRYTLLNYTVMSWIILSAIFFMSSDVFSIIHVRFSCKIPHTQTFIWLGKPHSLLR